MSAKPLQLKKNTEKQATAPASDNPWRILVVDDEEEIHSVTRMILSKIAFEDRRMDLLSAYSAKEAEEVLKTEKDIAVILLDVVMETDQAGLELVKVIREDLENKAVRIILRTGQPGQAPEESVIVDYDINDYKAKSELTAQKLFTTVVASLRSYRDITSLERTRQGLEKIIESSDSLFETGSLQKFASGVLEQLSAFLEVDTNGILCVETPDEGQLFPAEKPCEMRIVAASGEFDTCGECNSLEKCVHGPAIGLIRKSLENKVNIYGEDHTVIYLDTDERRGIAAVIHGEHAYTEEDRKLLNVFAQKISLALANLIHYSKMVSAEDAATKDYLTGLPNRRHLVDLADAMLSTAKRANLPTTVAMIDIDHFKAINDTHGHKIGDAVLKGVSKLLTEALRGSDLAARIGGEEFCVILNNTAGEDAKAVLDDLRGKIAAETFEVEGQTISVTISIGATSTLSDLDTMLAQADVLLYNAKEGGRDQVIFA